MPAPVWQASGGGQLLTQIAPWTGSQTAVAQLLQSWDVCSQKPFAQMPVSQQPGKAPPPAQGVLAVQVTPQAPQLLGSWRKSVQIPPQQSIPSSQRASAAPHPSLQVPPTQ